MTHIILQERFQGCINLKLGHAVEHLVQAQRYKPEGSIADGVIGIFH
jgi:hypothetical protein